MRYGPDIARERHDDGGCLARDPEKFGQSEGAGQALWDQSEEGCQVEEAHRRPRTFPRVRAPHARWCSVSKTRRRSPAFRRHRALPLDDCLYALQPTIPHLSRSALHRRPQRRRISRLPEIGGDKPAKMRFKRYPIGYFHIDLAEVRTVEGKSNLFVAINRTSKFVHPRLEKRAGKVEAAQFLCDLLQALPYRIHTVLTDNGMQFTTRALDSHAFAHIFDRVCRENWIEHRLTKVRHPWTNGQVERMNRTIKEATVKRFHYDDHSQRRDISRTSLTRITTPVD